MARRLVSIEVPASAIEVGGDSIPRLQGSPIERALSRILRPTLCAVARAVDNRFEIERIDLGHGFGDERLQFHAILNPPRQSDLMDTHPEDLRFVAEFVNVLHAMARCVVEIFKLQTNGQLVRLTFDRENRFSWSVSDENHIHVRGPATAQQSVRGLMALARRIAANRDAEVVLTIEREIHTFSHVRAPEEVAMCATELLTGVISAVDDRTNSLMLNHQSRTPAKVTHLSFPRELRDQSLEHQLHRRVVQVVAEISRRGKKQIAGEMRGIESVDGIAELKAAACGSAPSTPAQHRKSKTIRRKR